MSATNAFENAVGLLIFNNTNIANVGDATGLRGSSTAGSFYLSLHLADPGEAGDQTTSEISYTGYARQAVPRSSAGFTVTADTVTLAATVAFPASSGGAGGTVTHFGIGTDVSGAGNLLFKGTYTPNIAVTSGVTPRLTTGTQITIA
jgi:hypothetical protein